MTPAESITRAVLETHASAYHAAGTIYQQDRVIQQAVKTVGPVLEQIVQAEKSQPSNAKDSQPHDVERGGNY